ALAAQDLVHVEGRSAVGRARANGAQLEPLEIVAPEETADRVGDQRLAWLRETAKRHAPVDGLAEIPEGCCDRLARGEAERYPNVHASGPAVHCQPTMQSLRGA